jgi:hypothetical protein
VSPAGWPTACTSARRRAYLTPQPDDLFIGTVLTDGSTFRLSGDDLRNIASWQQKVQAMPVGATFRITFPFVGVEASDSDDLTQAAHQIGPQFFFISHTFNHVGGELQCTQR